ncbi:nitrous oxide reductase accessory protein NosL [Thermodesulfobacteriota bacterium]
MITTISTPGFAAELLELPDGSKVDLAQKCPVCSMIVGGSEGQGVTVSYKKGRVVGFGGVAATVFKDGKVVGFDGARCLFVYNSIPSKYGVDIADMKDQFVIDFTSKKMIKVEEAFLVLGSNVKGRMGYEMIPFTNKQEASKFASEHDGKWIVQLHSVVRGMQPKEEEGKTE